jgi:hypothetical protein
MEAAKESLKVVNPKLFYNLTRRIPNSGRYKLILRMWLASLTDPRIMVGRCSCGSCTDARGLFLLTQEQMQHGKPFLKDLLWGVHTSALEGKAVDEFSPELRCIRPETRMIGPLCLLNTATTPLKNSLRICRPGFGKYFVYIHAKAIKTQTIQPCELLLSYGCVQRFQPRDFSSVAHTPHNPTI